MEDLKPEIEVESPKATWEDPARWAAPNSRDPWARVCLACLNCVQVGHDCDVIGVMPQNQAPVCVVAMSKVQDVFRRRALWLNDVALELVSNLTVARACIQVLQDGVDDDVPDADETGIYIGEGVGET